MARQPLVAANWKMNVPPPGWDTPDSPYHPKSGVEVVVFPSHPDLPACVAAGLTVGAQYGRPEESGAFTGDVAMTQIAGLGARYVLCGHSERRSKHQETDAFITEQIEAAFKAGLTPILCIGETAAEREAGQAEQVVRGQLTPILEARGSRLEALIVAYEPVWAIGTGKTATPDDAQTMHAFIRGLLPPLYKEVTRILYGGSVKGANAADLISKPDIDGFLVGGASLIPEDFRKIVEIVAG